MFVILLLRGYALFCISIIFVEIVNGFDINSLIKMDQNQKYISYSSHDQFNWV